MASTEVRQPHPRNVPGPFYVVNGCCTTCMVPHLVAPALMGFDPVDNHCFVARQPGSDEELYQAIRAVWAAELQCLRYAGQDPAILRRLGEIGEEAACDEPVPPAIRPVLRNHATFESARGSDARDLAARLRDFIAARFQAHGDHRLTPVMAYGDEVGFSWSWFEGPEYPIRVGQQESRACGWLVHHSPLWEAGSVSVSLTVHDWLVSDSQFSSIRWYTECAWKTDRDEWRATPY